MSSAVGVARDEVGRTGGEEDVATVGADHRAGDGVLVCASPSLTLTWSLYCGAVPHEQVGRAVRVPRDEVRPKRCEHHGAPSPLIAGVLLAARAWAADARSAGRRWSGCGRTRRSPRCSDATRLRRRCERDVAPVGADRRLVAATGPAVPAVERLTRVVVPLRCRARARPPPRCLREVLADRRRRRSGCRR
jgi:hypothetical protein